MAGRILFGATIFLSAFLLFQVQPVIGKYILPWFGSSPGVWTTCLLFFQVLLLGGYAYAHFVVSRLGSRRQGLVHGALLVAALATLPITPAAAYKPVGDEAPVGRILLVLAMSVGLPYLLLSSTGPLLQGWFARLHPGRSPYRLYALSNFGSLLALLSYPVVVERVLALREQTGIWSLAYVLFALLCGGCALLLWRSDRPSRPRRDEVDPAAPTAAGPEPEEADYAKLDVALWFLLAACGSALLLATTNQMCLDVAVVPFLWVLPLGIYLLSFIFTFDHERWYVRPLFCALLPMALVAAFEVLVGGVTATLEAQIGAYAFALFVGCMCCHGELSRLKPAPRHLTFFFLIVSLGGAAGGLGVALGAPAWLQDFDEYPILLGATYVLVLFVAARQALGERCTLRRWGVGHLAWLGAWLLALVSLGYGVHLAFSESSWVDEDARRRVVADLGAWLDLMRVWVFAAPLLLLVLLEGARWTRGIGVRAWWGNARRLLATAGVLAGSVGLVAVVAAVGWQVRDHQSNYVVRGRNFYGVLAITEYDAGSREHDWTLKHGRIMHGFQYKRFPSWPTSYYGGKSGIGLAVRLHPRRWEAGRSFRIGVVGLGTGTMAAYANQRVDPDAERAHGYVRTERRVPGDYVRFYEINPMVVEWAYAHFTYLPDALRRGADADVFLGDARLVMERQLAEGAAQRFDVLAIDAFSSDAIPIHLLTKESLEIYWRHLADDGVLAVHVTNRYIALVPVVHRLALALGKEVIHVADMGDDDHGGDSSDWLLLTSNQRLVDAVHRAGRVKPLGEPGPLWTDDYSSVWEQLKFDKDDGR